MFTVFGKQDFDLALPDRNDSLILFELWFIKFLGEKVDLLTDSDAPLKVCPEKENLL